MISPLGVLGSPLRHTSLVSARPTPQLPSRKPICWLPESYGDREGETDRWINCYNPYPNCSMMNVFLMRVMEAVIRKKKRLIKSAFEVLLDKRNTD